MRLTNISLHKTDPVHSSLHFAIGVARSLLVMCSALGFLLPATVGATNPPRVALVVGIENYASLPAIPACSTSARLVAEAYHGIGFEVIMQLDAGRGELDAAITRFSRQLSTAPGGTAAVYFCGYATDYNERTFLLPSSAVIGSETDILAQGVIAKALQDSVARGRTRVGLVTVDTVTMSGGRARATFGGLAEQASASGHGFVAVVERGTGRAPSALSTALKAELELPDPKVSTLVAGTQRRLADHRGVEILAAVGGRAYASLAAASHGTPQEAQATQKSVVRQTEAPLQSGTELGGSASAAVGAAVHDRAEQLVSIPDETRMTEGNRRQVQAELAKLGYYNGRLDGIFGPETRAAIRRYQFEIRAEMTGIITSEQAIRLTSGLR